MTAPTIFTPMPIFSKPGPLRDLLEARGFAFERVEPAAAQKGAADHEAVAAALVGRAAAMEFLFVGTIPLRGEFFSAAKRLRLVAMFGVGIDHIDVRAAAEHGVLVTNVPGGNSRCVSELAFALMLDLAHKVTEMHTDLHGGVWRPRLGTELTGKTLGIVGLGHIGQDVARIGKALGMTVIAANRTPKPDVAASLGLAQLPLEDVLAEADYLSLHIPGGPGSWHFGAEEFAKMKKTAFVINTARGDLLDIEALTLAITEKRLAGAGLDVFPQEPMDPAHRIFSLPQVVTTPHAGAASKEAMARVCSSCLDEVDRILRKERSPNARNPEVYDLPAWKGF